MFELFYNKKTHGIERVDVERKISYDWGSIEPKIADFQNLSAISTVINTERKRDILYKLRWFVIFSIIIIGCFAVIIMINTDNPSTSRDSNDIIRIQKMITSFDSENKTSFGDWRTCKIISECIGKTDNEIQQIIESNYLEIIK